jgi:hypothetical protein
MPDVPDLPTESSDPGRTSGTVTIPPTRAKLRLRLLNRVLDRLGLLDVLGRDWVTVDETTGRVSFGDLDPERYQTLQMHLDDLAGGPSVEVRATTPSSGRSRGVAVWASGPVRPPRFLRRRTAGPHLGGRA